MQRIRMSSLDTRNSSHTPPTAITQGLSFRPVLIGLMKFGDLYLPHINSDPVALERRACGRAVVCAPCAGCGATRSVCVR
jgi:hypothetical protein